MLLYFLCKLHEGSVFQLSKTENWYYKYKYKQLNRYRKKSGELASILIFRSLHQTKELSLTL
jgi:hypothetical protein